MVIVFNAHFNNIFKTIEILSWSRSSLVLVKDLRDDMGWADAMKVDRIGKIWLMFKLTCLKMSLD